MDRLNLATVHALGLALLLFASCGGGDGDDCSCLVGESAGAAALACGQSVCADGVRYRCVAAGQIEAVAEACGDEVDGGGGDDAIDAAADCEALEGECFFDDECCSGACAVSPVALYGYCVPATDGRHACGPGGSECSNAGVCCSDRCFEFECTGSPEPGSCRAWPWPCRTDDDCCNHTCVADGADKYCGDR